VRASFWKLPIGRMTPIGYSLDCAFFYSDPKSLQEIEFVFTSLSDKNDCVRLLSWRSIAICSEKQLPPLDEQPCDVEVLVMAGTPVFHAFLQKEKGPHEALWQTALRSYICRTKPGPSFGRVEFEDLLEFLVPATCKLTM
jgi:hypothetical protein